MMENRSGFSLGSEKGVVECDVGLGLRMQQQPPAGRKTAVAPPSAGEFGGGVATSPGAPILSNFSNQTASLSDPHDAFGAVSDYGGAILTKSLQPFGSDSFPFASSGMRVPFTASQWQELERQTMIYEFMMASIPVPHELLLPVTKQTSNLAYSNSNRFLRGSLEMGVSSNSDPEPWRCRRTDGKKWRCSRDVAPDQKYCERHSHKTRPRSRKPVELHSENRNHIAASTVSHPATTQTTSTSLFSTVLAAARCSDWCIRGEPTSVSMVGLNREWQATANSKVGLKRDSCMTLNTNLNALKQQNLVSREPPESSSEYVNGQRLQKQRLNDRCSLLLGPSQIHETRHLLDAWSVAERDSNKCSPSSSLSLSMCAADEENGQMGLGTVGLVERANSGELKQQPHWMSSRSWLGSTPGGPLAEALFLGMSSSANGGESSPYGGNSSTTSNSKSSCGDSGHGLNQI